MYYDAMVMGAGPAGCMAARALSDAGFKVVLCERERLPRDKTCGGFLSPQAASLVEEAFGPIPASCRDVPETVRGARLLCAGGGDYELPFSGPGISVLRSRLDAHLAAHCGAEVMDACEVGDFRAERFHVTARLITGGREEKVEATYLVAADGAESMALRLLRPEFHRLYAATHLERSMLVLSQGEMDWDQEWIGLALVRKGMGIARFFVKGDLIGLAVNHDAARGWRDELDGLIALLGERTGLRLHGDVMRRISASNRMAAAGHYSLGAGSALIAGEAAGLLDPWGFGIRLALESGRVAAESLAESAGERITPHIRYRYRMQEILEREVKQRRDLSAGVGDLDTTSLSAGGSRAARRDRRALRRRFSR
ncbi:MAG: NAD(P)/FAD-dependent oxidoreductase [Actinobacteria bacterium]|nr:NAD(P)/FAD-dependent oxidoreductase [Actinomycetota bacterium]